VLGRSTHEIGPLLGPKWPNRYGKQGEKTVQRDMVFTIEPSVTSKLGTCNLEQDVLVTSNGYQELSKPQDEIIQLG
jgi:Xaa-Pro aminopeptidase